MGLYLIKNALIINEGSQIKGHLEIDDQYISGILNDEEILNKNYDKIINAEDKILIPGIIDDQVHFREPGLTHKGDIYSESRAAVAGGVTSFMEMPNTNPQTITQVLLEEKYKIAEQKSLANYSFYLGATNDNINEIINTNPKNVCGIKIFMGASTGNMLVDNIESLNNIFKNSPLLIATHCEDEQIIKRNTAIYKQKYGNNIPVEYHPFIRNEEACYKSSSLAVELAEKYNSRLHILHVSTAKELNLFNNKIPLNKKRITSEICVHHLWFSDENYKKLGPKIKWNPAIKAINNKENLFKGLLNNKLDIIATDHAPHTYEEKQINIPPSDYNYFKSPSGGPLVQHSLNVMLEFYKKGMISLEKIVEKMCHAPAKLFQIEKRGFIKKGFYADLAIVDLNTKYTVSKNNILYKCKWSPFEGENFNSKVTHTFVNGELVFENDNIISERQGMRLSFNR